MARNVVSGPGRNNTSLLLTVAFGSVLVILVYVYWNKTSRIRQLHEESDVLTKAVQNARVDIKTLQDRVNELAEDLASTQQLKVEVEKKQSALELQLAEGARAMRTAESNLKTLTDERDSCKKELSSKESELRETTVSVNDLKAKMNVCEVKIDGLSKDLVAAKDANLSQQKELSELEEKKNSIIKGLQDELLAVKEQCSKPEVPTDAR